MVDDYWEYWRPEWLKSFVAVDEACDQFLHERNREATEPRWSVVKYRWDNPDRLLSGAVLDGFWGNIHILLLPEASKFRLSYAAWRDEDVEVAHGGYRVSKRFWVTSDDNRRGDQYLPIEAPSKAVKLSLDEAWDGLVALSKMGLSKQGKFREDIIKLPL